MTPARTIFRLLAAAALGGGLWACTPTVKIEPIKVEPIHVTLDINLKVDRELDDFFAFEKQAVTTAPAPGAAQP
ncbi:MAG: hypothetical protein IT443_06690 [Phycisphaeraceae bacterium]|nr:hypothetical protein [Phycisphaeraceae bacterium]